MKKLILLVSLLLASCGTLPANFTVVRDSTPRSVVQQSTPTASQIPTATQDISATMEVIQQARLDNGNTEIALQSLIISATQTAEANAVLIAQANAQQAQANAQAEQKKFDTAAMIYSGNQTQQAFIKSRDETAIPLTQSAQKTNVPLIAAALQATIAAPENLRIMNEQQFQQDYAWLLPFSVVCACLFMFGLLVYVFRRDNRPMEEETEQEPPLTIYNKDTSNGGYKLTKKTTVVPCNPEQFMMFAKGIREDGMTLAINPWQRKGLSCIDKLRTFMIDNNFAYELRAKLGELAMLPAGDDWLDDCIALGELPLPYTYALPSPESNNALKASPVA